jgi:hypothetical protein
MSEQYEQDRALLIEAAKRTCETDRIECLDALQDLWRLGDLFATDHDYGVQLVVANKRLARATFAQDASENAYRALLHSWCDRGVGHDIDGPTVHEIHVRPGDDLADILRRLIEGEEG